MPLAKKGGVTIDTIAVRTLAQRHPAEWRHEDRALAADAIAYLIAAWDARSRSVSRRAQARRREEGQSDAR